MARHAAVRAVTSISIFIRGSISPATIIVAAGARVAERGAELRPAAFEIVPVGQDVADADDVGEGRARRRQRGPIVASAAAHWSSTASGSVIVAGSVPVQPETNTQPSASTTARE